MSRFADLLRPGPRWPGDQQREAIRRFPEVVARSPLKLWRPGDPIPPMGDRVLIGVAAGWSLPELLILDALAEEVAQGRTTAKVEVFDLSALEDASEMDRYHPRPRNRLPDTGRRPLGEWGLEGAGDRVRGSRAGRPRVRNRAGIASGHRPLLPSVATSEVMISDHGYPHDSHHRAGHRRSEPRRPPAPCSRSLGGVLRAGRVGDRLGDLHRAGAGGATRCRRSGRSRWPGSSAACSAWPGR